MSALFSAVPSLLKHQDLISNWEQINSYCVCVTKVEMNFLLFRLLIPDQITHPLQLLSFSAFFFFFIKAFSLRIFPIWCRMDSHPALSPLLCICRGLWGPVLWDGRVGQLEWWREPGAAVVLTQTAVSLFERQNKIAWKLWLFCTLLFRHTEAKKIVIFTFVDCTWHFFTLLQPVNQ